MYKLIIFDLDGVLVDAKKIHYKTLNEALGEEYKISWDEHLHKYDGLKTKQKLLILTKEKGLPETLYEYIWTKKQELTILELNNLEESEPLIYCFEQLSSEGYRLAVCSNSISNTVIKVLEGLNIKKFFSVILSNEDVENSKPHPEIYWKCMSMMKVLPEETLIVEDSPVGLLSAGRSGAKILRVSSPNDVNYDNIMKNIKNSQPTNPPKWVDKNLNIVIPMAGAGSRFEKAGYSFPKPLIDVNGKPMIQVVVDNLNIDANYIFIVQKEHREKYNLDIFLNLITPNCKIIEVDGLTEGAACTTLLSKEFINNEYPLILCNSDQYIEWNSSEFMYKMYEQNCDGGIVTFTSSHPKWSFVRLDDKQNVCEVAEKKPISNIATTGIYYWKKGEDYVKFAEKMIKNNIRINNEFYVCPVFNEAILENKQIRTYQIEKMWGLGTPEDLNIYLNK
jgi:HAD superfamily hydrolase (TIGR01509 family)